MSDVQEKSAKALVIKNAVMSKDPLALVPAAKASRSSMNNEEANLPFRNAEKAPGLGQVQAPDPCQTGYQEGFEKGAQEGFAAGQEKGRQAGWEKGLTEGRAQGAKEAALQSKGLHDALKDRIIRLEKLLSDLPLKHEDLILNRIKGLESDMLDLCFVTICKILGDQFAHRKILIEQIKHAMGQCSSQGKSSIFTGLHSVHIHPADLEILNEDTEFSSWMAKQSPDIVVGDESIQLGGCMVYSEQGHLDARLETQLTTLHECFSRHRSAFAAVTRQNAKDGSSEKPAERPVR